MPFQANVMHVVSRRDKISPAVQARHLLDVQHWQEIILIGEVPDSPNQPRRRRFGTRLRTHLDSPLDTILVDDVKFWAGAIHVLLLERERSAGCVALSARSVEQVSG